MRKGALANYIGGIQERLYGLSNRYSRGWFPQVKYKNIRILLFFLLLHKHNFISFVASNPSDW